jgi:hypothetical protein
MALWLRMMVTFTVLLVPGGFFLLLAYVYARTLRQRWRLAHAAASGAPVSLRDVAFSLSFKDLVAEARATATF